MAVTRMTSNEASLDEHRKPVAAAVSGPLVADLWELFDDVCDQLNVYLEAAGVSRRIIVTHRGTARRYGNPATQGGERFIALLPLVPTATGSAVRGVFVGTSGGRRTAYVKPVVEDGTLGWRLTSSGALLDRAAVQALFGWVFGALSPDHK